jgi:hypothetical protein
MKKLSMLLALTVAGCGGGKVTLTSGAEACVTATACGIAFQSFAGFNFTGVSACTQLADLVNNKEFAGAVKIGPTEVNCLAAAGKDCTKARACLNGGQNVNACSGGSAQCTDSSHYSECSRVTGSGTSEGTRSFDCTQAGESCVASGNNIDCGAGSCGAVVSVSCMGNVLQSCVNGVLHNHDCAATAEECIPQSGLSIAHCRGTGPTCSSPSATNNVLRCDGSTLVTCNDGKEARFDCNSLGMGCYTRYGSSTQACLYGAECDPATYTNVCMGSQLKFCDNGKVVTVDCGAAGFSGCDPSNGGSCKI